MSYHCGPAFLGVVLCIWALQNYASAIQCYNSYSIGENGKDTNLGDCTRYMCTVSRCISVTQGEVKEHSYQLGCKGDEFSFIPRDDSWTTDVNKGDPSCRVVYTFDKGVTAPFGCALCDCDDRDQCISDKIGEEVQRAIKLLSNGSTKVQATGSADHDTPDGGETTNGGKKWTKVQPVVNSSEKKEEAKEKVDGQSTKRGSGSGVGRRPTGGSKAWVGVGAIMIKKIAP